MPKEVIQHTKLIAKEFDLIRLETETAEGGMGMSKGALSLIASINTLNKLIIKIHQDEESMLDRRQVQEKLDKTSKALSSRYGNKE